MRLLYPGGPTKISILSRAIFIRSSRLGLLAFVLKRKLPVTGELMHCCQHS
jgi:hypothetical protein